MGPAAADRASPLAVLVVPPLTAAKAPLAVLLDPPLTAAKSPLIVFKPPDHEPPEAGEVVLLPHHDIVRAGADVLTKSARNSL